MSCLAQAAKDRTIVRTRSMAISFFMFQNSFFIYRTTGYSPIILQDFRKSIFFTAFIQLFPENIDAHPDPADRKTDQQRLGNAGQRP